MSTMARDHEQWAESLGAWLLGALPDDEAVGFKAHLAECPVCREDAAFLQVAADALPASAVQVPAPPALKDRIMAVVQQEAQLLAAAGPEADRPKPARERRRRLGFGSLSWRPAFVLPVTLLLLMLGGGAALVAQRSLDDERTLPAQIARERAGTGARAELMVGNGNAVLTGTRLPAPPRGRVYQVWLDRGGEVPEPTSALFSPRRDGSASVSVPGSLKGVRQVLVTDEPEGGSNAPTREPTLTVNTT